MIRRLRTLEELLRLLTRESIILKAIGMSVPAQDVNPRVESHHVTEAAGK